MLMILTMAAVSCAAFLITLSRVIGFNTILKYSVLIDVLFTIGTFMVFAGTITGALVAVVGGLMMAVFLTMAKQMKRGGKAVAKAVHKVAVKRGQHVCIVELPKGADPTEYNAAGEWLYNTAMYK